MHFLMYPEERTAVFVDAGNFHAAARAIGFDVDYARLLHYFASRSRLVRAFYYSVWMTNTDGPGARPLADWLEYNGFAVTLRVQADFDETARYARGQLNMDMTVDLFDLTPMIDHAILFTGDGDFVPLVRAVQRRGIRVSVVSTAKKPGSIVSDDLRRAADRFIELDGLFEEFRRGATATPAETTGAHVELTTEKKPTAGRTTGKLSLSDLPGVVDPKIRRSVPRGA